MPGALPDANTIFNLCSLCMLQASDVAQLRSEIAELRKAINAGFSVSTRASVLPVSCSCMKGAQLTRCCCSGRCCRASHRHMSPRTKNSRRSCRSSCSPPRTSASGELSL